MAQLGSFLDTGDKIASIVGGVAAIVGLWVAVHAASRRQRLGRPDGRVTTLAIAQRADAARHRYRFFGEHVPALTDLYVQPRASTGRPADNHAGGRAAGEMSRTVPATQVLTTHRHAVLLGDAGAGKSTFLATVAGDMARRALARRGTGELAIIVHASDLPGRTLPEALRLAVHRDLGVDLTAEVFERLPAGANAWRILVDGLDEVIDAHDRSAVLWRIRDLLTDGGAFRIVVACRPLTEPELAELRGPDVGAYDLRPFDRRELDQFARRWFTARYPDDRRRADEMAGRFLARIAGARLGPVARVPLLATIAALVYELQDDRALPSSRAALYERFVDHLLDGRRSLDRFRDAVEPELLSRGATGKALADWLTSDLHLHVGGLLEACGAAWLADPEVRLTEVAAAWIRANGPHDLTRVTPDAHRLLRELLLTTGVCTLRRERVVFAHQSFAEYFAAGAGAATFDAATWLTRAIDPVTRSLAAFAAARRPDANHLVTVLLDRGEATAAGDLLADGVPMRPATRARTVDLLLGQITEEADQAPEALRLLGELSVDADVLRRMTALAADPDVSAWTRALVADRIASIDPTAGNRLLRAVAEHADDVVRGWVADAVEEHGGRVDPLLRVPLADDVMAGGVRPLGVLARHALAQRLTDIRATESERLYAAQQLARGGDLAPLRAMAEAGDVSPLGRVEIAAALADAGDPGLLQGLATGGAGSAQAAYAAAVALFAVPIRWPPRR